MKPTGDFLDHELKRIWPYDGPPHAFVQFSTWYLSVVRKNFKDEVRVQLEREVVDRWIHLCLIWHRIDVKSAPHGSHSVGD